jgi:hypothetical protein
VGFRFPHLYDRTRMVAKAYEVACTPDFTLFDGEFRLVYRGQTDASRPEPGIPETGADMRPAAHPSGWRSGVGRATREHWAQYQVEVVRGVMSIAPL